MNYKGLSHKLVGVSVRHQAVEAKSQLRLSRDLIVQTTDCLGLKLSKVQV